MGRRALALAALAVLAVLINLHAPTVFFDMQLMLGSGVAVLALLLFGWSGLLVGAAALAVTVVRWGHPFELLIGMGLLIWLRWFLDRFNGGSAQQTNGRIVLAAIGYWLVVGVPAEMVLFILRLGVDPVKALGLGLKEAVVSVLCVALGMTGFLIWRSWRQRRASGRLSARSITFATMLLAVSLPGVLITLILSGQLKTTAMEAQFQAMTRLAEKVQALGQFPASAEVPGGAALWQTSAGPRSARILPCSRAWAGITRRTPPAGSAGRAWSCWCPAARLRCWSRTARRTGGCAPGRSRWWSPRTR
jgi:hypothetical protein